MIFTIGHSEIYELLDKKEAVFKKGQRSSNHPEGYYPGEHAFRTYEDAQCRIEEAYKDKGFTIYGLLATWERGTYPAPDGWWHYLVADTKVVQLCKECKGTGRVVGRQGEGVLVDHTNCSGRGYL